LAREEEFTAFKIVSGNEFEVETMIIYLPLFWADVRFFWVGRQNSERIETI